MFRTALLAKLACFGLAFAVCWAVVASVGLAAVRQRRAFGVVHVVPRPGDGPATLPELLARVTDRVPWRAMVLVTAAVPGLAVAASEAASVSTIRFTMARLSCSEWFHPVRTALRRPLRSSSHRPGPGRACHG